jgi:hypothetical protein
LLDIKSQNKNKLSARCSEMLADRKELWKMAEVSDPLDGLNDLARVINKSGNRSYILLILVVIVSAVFLMGCLCRPAVSKHRFHKLK